MQSKRIYFDCFVELEKIIIQQNVTCQQIKLVFDEFVKSKETDFIKYKNFIIKTEYRVNANGAKRLYVESVDPALMF